MARSHQGRVKSRFVAAPSKASPSIYTKGLGWKHGPEEMGLLMGCHMSSWEMGDTEHSLQEGVSRAMHLLKRTELLGNPSREER